MDSVRTAFDALSGATALLADGRWIYANPAFSRLVGGDVCGRAALDLVALPERDAVAHWYRGKVGVHATRWRRDDGSEVAVEVATRELTFEGTPAILITATDLSAREVLFQRLSQSEESFRALVEASPDAMFVHADDDDDYVVLWANPAMLHMLGYEHSSELVGRRSLDTFVHADDREAVIQYRHRVRTGGDPELTVRWIARDGRVLHMAGTRRRVRFADTRAILVIARDRTEELARERERREAEAAIRESELRYRKLFDGSPHPICLFDAETFHYLAVNDKMVEVYGYSREEFAAMTVRDVAEAPPGKHVHSGIVKHRRKDGAMIDIDITSHQVIVDGRKCALAIGIDVTERRRVEEQLRQSQRMEAIGQLAGGVAHDFNNMLAVILSAVEYVREELGDHHTLSNDVADIESAAQRAAGLTRQLLAFSRKQPHTPKIVSLRAVVEDLEKMLRRVVPEDIELTTSLSSPGKIEVDVGHLEQVIMNLVVNARDAMPEGGKLSIETKSVLLDEAGARYVGVAPGAYMTVSVSDTGIGMDEATKRRIFDPFFTTKEVGRGTGLGLATVFGIVKQSGGAIAVYSELGRGSRFRVYLPRVDNDHSSPAIAVPMLACSGGPESILLVEDDPQLRAVILRRLVSLGYRIREAKDARAAMDVLAGAGERIDLLLTDLVMPGMDGRALAAKLLERQPDLKVLFMSGYSEHSAVKTAALGPADHFIEKPFTAGDLSMAVRRALQPDAEFRR